MDQQSECELTKTSPGSRDGGGANQQLGHVLDKDRGALTWKAYKDYG